MYLKFHSQQTLKRKDIDREKTLKEKGGNGHILIQKEADMDKLKGAMSA